MSNATISGNSIAQSFLVTSNGNGVFLTDVDLYFHSKDVSTDTYSVMVEIREMYNGYPTVSVLPLSSVVKTSDIVFSDNSLVPTKFVFQSPVYLREGVEYCIVVNSASFDIKLWVSEMGSVDLEGRMIVEQPLCGSLFISQNSSTWTAEQYLDLCFELNKAEFDVKKTGHITLMNNVIRSRLLNTDSIRFVKDKSVARILRINHGLIDGDFIIIEDPDKQLTYDISTSFPRYFDPLTPEIPAINNPLIFKVKNVTDDSFLIDINPATKTMWHGKRSIRVLPNRPYDLLYLNGNDFVLSDTFIEYTYKKTNEERIKEFEEYQIFLRQNTKMDKRGWILSSENEEEFLNGQKSFEINAYLYTSDPDVSPVMDLSSYSINNIMNRISNYDGSINNEIDLVLIYSPGIDIVNHIFTETNNSIYIDCDIEYMYKFNIGQYIKLPNAVINTGAYKIIDIDIVQNILYTDSILSNETIGGDVYQYDFYTDSISSKEPSNLATYIPLDIKLTTPAQGFKVLFDYNLPFNTQILIYMKTGYEAEYRNIKNEVWELISDVSPYVNTSNDTIFTEKTIDVEFDQNSLFDALQIKLEFRSSDTTRVPRIKNFRLITVL